MLRILIYDTFPKTRTRLAQVLREHCAVTCISDQREFLEKIKNPRFDLVLLDIDSAGQSPLSLVERLHRVDPFLPLIVTSREEKAELILEAIKKGASDFLVHPVSSTRIRVVIDKIIESRSQRFELAYHRRRQRVVNTFDEVVARSECMKKCIRQLEKYVGDEQPILLEGDIGTGKKYLSGVIHLSSPGRNRPLIRIRCFRREDKRLERELFGYEKSETGDAGQMLAARFAQPDGATLLFEEIGELGLEMQKKLLHVLQKQMVGRAGGGRAIPRQFRIIATSCTDLEKLVGKGEFLDELYQCIARRRVVLPTLKERRQCLVPLAEMLLTKWCGAHHREISGFSERALEKIRRYDWPANIRELANVIERAVILEKTSVIGRDSLSLTLSQEKRTGTSRDKKTNIGRTGVLLAEQEKELILQVLKECMWIQKSAAEKLGISPRALNYKIARFGITHPHWRKNRSQS
ncbi:sigma-54-dependent transcriptional regulator [Desulforhopalus singaporensis]|uniref:Two-component system, NtrC family, response regulator HydG n=1 Tax=Desulforhopalus singaporensis TaxID=91360 RepID=A0A1H0NVA2_9BACT|nr:sigma 54-interacting transcriptional regulator [Desulforhopalus singaporensis]SDO96631.1 two-component system, NtrC family, response regulator HydG [Desulforhopalus singaporensis]